MNRMIDVYMNNSIIRVSIWFLVAMLTFFMLLGLVSLYANARTTDEFLENMKRFLIVYIILMIVGVLGLLLFGHSGM